MRDIFSHLQLLFPPVWKGTTQKINLHLIKSYRLQQLKLTAYVLPIVLIQQLIYFLIIPDGQGG